MSSDSLKEDDISPPNLNRQHTSRMDTLDSVGLGKYRDVLVKHGLQKVEDLVKFSRQDLTKMGLDQTAQNIAALLTKKSSTGQIRRQTSMSDQQLTPAPSRVECSICEDEQADYTLTCCGIASCGGCFRQGMIHMDKWCVETCRPIHVIATVTPAKSCLLWCHAAASRTEMR